jgi:hypothetical protein
LAPAQPARSVLDSIEHGATLDTKGLPNPLTAGRRSYGVSYDPTWRKRAGVNLKANAQVAGFLFNAAKSGNVTAQIFWLKTRAKWRETPMELKHSGSIGRRDLSEVSDEELLNMISTLSAEVGLAPAKTIDMEPDPSSTERPEGNVLRLMPKN